VPELLVTRKSLPLLQGLSPGVQRVGLLADVPQLLRELGVRPATVLRRAGLAAADLADQDRTIPFARLPVLLAECARATKCSHFGLLMGSRWRLEHLGRPGALALGAATVGRALERFTTAQWMNSSGGVAFLERRGGMTGLGYAIFEPGTPEGTSQVHDLAAAIAVGILRQLSGKPAWQPVVVHLSRRTPSDTGPYRAFFRCVLHFDAEASVTWFLSAFEETPVAGRRGEDEPAVAAAVFLRDESFTPKVYRFVRIALQFGLTSGDEVAAAMGMTRRTFNRRLQEHGMTYREALRTVRLEAARQLLRDTKLSVSEISAALGYAEPSVFVRAFQRWAGAAPNQWRTGRSPARRRANDPVLRHVK